MRLCNAVAQSSTCDNLQSGEIIVLTALDQYYVSGAHAYNVLLLVGSGKAKHFRQFPAQFRE